MYPPLATPSTPFTPLWVSLCNGTQTITFFCSPRFVVKCKVTTKWGYPYPNKNLF